MNLMTPLVAEGKWAEAGKILNKMSDDELTSDATVKMINENPDLILQLSGAKIEKLMSKVLVKKDGSVNAPVLHMMKAAQLEAIRRSSNVDPDMLTKLGTEITGNVNYRNFYTNLSRKPDRQQELRDAWGHAHI